MDKCITVSLPKDDVGLRKKLMQMRKLTGWMNELMV